MYNGHSLLVPRLIFIYKFTVLDVTVDIRTPIINTFHFSHLIRNDLCLYFIAFSELRDYFEVVPFLAKIRNGRVKERFILCDKKWGLARPELDLVFNNGTSIPVKYAFFYDSLSQMCTYGCKFIFFVNC